MGVNINRIFEPSMICGNILLISKPPDILQERLNDMNRQNLDGDFEMSINKSNLQL